VERKNTGHDGVENLTFADSRGAGEEKKKETREGRKSGISVLGNKKRPGSGDRKEK